VRPDRTLCTALGSTYTAQPYDNRAKCLLANARAFVKALAPMREPQPPALDVPAARIALSFDHVYAELKNIARAELASSAAQTLSATALVHEAYVRLAGYKQTITDRGHLVSLVVRAMRHVLIDTARKRAAEKRGGALKHITLDPTLAQINSDDDLFALDQAIQTLKQRHARMGSVVEMHFFGGVDFDEIALLLKVDRRTVGRDWTAAKALIARSLTEPNA